MKIINNQPHIKFEQFTQDGLDVVLTKIKIRKAVGLDEIPPEVWKIRKFDDIQLRYSYAVYNQNTTDRWTKGFILPFLKKSDLGITKNYQDKTHTSKCSATQLHLTRDRENSQEESKLFLKTSIHDITHFDDQSNHSRAKNLQTTPLFVHFSKAFYSIHRGKMKQILLANGLPKETVAAIMMLYENMKVKVHSTNGDSDFFDIVAGDQQGNALAPYQFIICLDYVLPMSID